jgi:hypothetical protein
VTALRARAVGWAGRHPWPAGMIAAAILLTLLSAVFDALAGGGGDLVFVVTAWLVMMAAGGERVTAFGLPAAWAHPAPLTGLVAGTSGAVRLVADLAGGRGIVVSVLVAAAWTVLVVLVTRLVLRFTERLRAA